MSKAPPGDKLVSDSCGRGINEMDNKDAVFVNMGGRDTRDNGIADTYTIRGSDPDIYKEDFW